ncbi:glycosyltransferase family 25 protein [Nanoarchaeota archaeon]
MKIEGLGRIYIIHYVKLKERRDYLEKRLNELGLGKYAHWILMTKNGRFTKKELAIHDPSKKALKEREKILEMVLPKIGEIDKIMMLQHIQIMKMIAQRKNDKISMVLEDDALLSDDFPLKLSHAIKKLREIKWDICYSDQGSALVEPKVQRKKGERVSLYNPPNKMANTTGSYLITPKSAKKFLKLMKKITIGPDLELSYTQKKYGLKVYWTVPFLTHQGSIEMIYDSNVRKSSLFSVGLKFIKKIERISPFCANGMRHLLKRIMDLLYKSRFLLWVKDKLKKVLRY